MTEGSEGCFMFCCLAATARILRGSEYHSALSGTALSSGSHTHNIKGGEREQRKRSWILLCAVFSSSVFLVFNFFDPAPDQFSELILPSESSHLILIQ
jgi:hypothetical protein